MLVAAVGRVDQQPSDGRVRSGGRHSWVLGSWVLAQAAQFGPQQSQLHLHLWDLGNPVFFSIPVLGAGFFFFFFFGFSSVTPAAYEVPRLIVAVAADLRQSHSNTTSESCLQTTPQLLARPDPQPTEQGQESNPQHHGS